MEKRKAEIDNLKLYTQKIENEVTLLLQNLQWESKHLLQAPAMSVCKYDINHKIPTDKKKIHEDLCYLKCEGYTKEDLLLPEPFDCNASSLVKLSTQKITEIIENAAKVDPLFKKGPENSAPLSFERLQCAYSADERRAIHDAVVDAAPSCHDLTDLALLSTTGENEKGTKTKTRMEILVELRNMKRRRTKYRVAAKTKNYSDVLRDVIKTQMEVYTETHVEDSTSKSQGNNDSMKTNDTHRREFLDESGKNPQCNKNFDGGNDTGHYKKYKDYYDKANKPEGIINAEYKVSFKKDDKRDERKHQKDKNYYDIYDRNNSGHSDSRFHNEKHYLEKESSNRDKHRSNTERKRFEETRSSSSERRRNGEKRKYYDRYYRDEKRQSDDRTYANKLKRYDKMKQTIEEGYMQMPLADSISQEGYKREKHNRDKKEFLPKRYYEFDNSYNNYKDS